MAGFFKMHRGWQDNPVFKKEPFCQRAAWAWLIENCAWKSCERRDAQGNIVTVERGQIHTSTRALGGAWGWSKNKVSRFLRDLKTCHMLDHQTDQSGMLLTVCNYEKYQGEWTSDGPVSGPANGTATDQRRTTQEEGKERKEEKKGAYAFAGRVIRLNQRDFDQWSETFHRIPDIRAELTSLDAWIAEEPEARRKKWFNIVSGALNKKHQTAAAPVKVADWEFSSPC